MLRFLTVFLAVATALLPAPAATAAVPRERVIAAGDHYTCVIAEAGGVECLGSNAGGTLGVLGERYGSALGFSTRPTTVAGTGTAQTLAAGAEHACAVLAAGTVRCWGDDEYGQRGDGPADANVPQDEPATGLPSDVRGVSDAIDVAAGERHSCAALRSGRVQCWGSGRAGQLGDGSSAVRVAPGPPVAGITDAVAVTAGNEHSCALGADGTVQCWGQGDRGQVGNGAFAPQPLPVVVSGLTDVTAIAAADDFTCAVHGAGAVSCWGSLPQPGDTATPRLVPGLGDGVSDVAPGRTHICALQREQARCWGRNSSGQLGDGSGPRVIAELPTQVLGAGDARALASGPEHVCAVRRTGAVACWGSGWLGVMGRLSTSATPVAVPGLNAVRQIALGEGSQSSAAGCAVRHEGSVWCWGRGMPAGAFGLPYDQSTLTPLRVPGLDDAVAATVGGAFGCARRSGGTVACWGDGQQGQLGVGSTPRDALPATAVPGLAGVSAVSAGERHACALRGGAVWCWGENSSGAIGDGTTQRRSSPVPVQGINDAVAIDAGASATCALRSGGAVSCWGQEAVLGEASTTNSLVPVTVITAGAAAIAVGSSHACALIGSEPRCWGRGYAGLPRGDETSRVPVAVPGAGAATALAIGGAVTCTQAPGAARCWGRLPRRTTPTDVPGGDRFVQVTAGSEAACGVRDDATAACWGNGEEGAFGDGPMPDGHVPFQPLAADIAGFAIARVPGGRWPAAPPVQPGPPGVPASPTTPPAAAPGGPAAKPAPVLEWRDGTLRIRGLQLTLRSRKRAPVKACATRVSLTLAGTVATKRRGRTVRTPVQLRRSLRPGRSATGCTLTATVRLPKTMRAARTLRLRVRGTHITSLDRRLTPTRSTTGVRPQNA